MRVRAERVARAGADAQAPDGAAPGGRPARRRFGRNREGVAAVEFALLGLPFFMLVFAIIETSLVFLAELTLDAAVEKVGRQVRTGSLLTAGTDGKPLTEAEFRKAICDEVDFLLTCSKLKIDLRSYTDFSISPASPIKDGDIDTTGFGYALPGRQTITALRVYYKWPLTLDFMRKGFTEMKDGSALLVGMSAFRTEPF